MKLIEHDPLLELLTTPSPTGQEIEGQKVWTRAIRKFASNLECDAYGSAWAVRHGKSERVILLEAHADEIGYMVKYIDPSGFIRLDRVGGTDVATAQGRKVTILGEKGPVSGIIGNTAVHMRSSSGSETAPTLSSLWVDIGANSASEVAEAGVDVGHHVIYQNDPIDLLNDRLVGRALDNRVGSYILVKVMEKVSAMDSAPSTTVCLNAVQEEIGGNGAMMAVQRIKPHLVITIDATHATDTPGLNPAAHGSLKLGAGPVLTNGAAVHPFLFNKLAEIGRASGIPLQKKSSGRSTGTDTDKIFTSNAGIPSALVSYPIRYMHSAVETADLNDINHTIDLLAAFVHSFDPTEDFVPSLEL